MLRVCRRPAAVQPLQTFKSAVRLNTCKAFAHCAKHSRIADGLLRMPVL
jgi:hypothetical protein